MVRAIIYRRISTAGQKDNNSLDMQERDCRAYAAKHGMTVIDVISDQASGATLDRIGLDKLRDRAEAGEMEAGGARSSQARSVGMGRTRRSAIATKGTSASAR